VAGLGLPPHGRIWPEGAPGIREVNVSGQNVLAEQAREDALTRAADLLGGNPAHVRQALSQLWALAFEQGRLAALDELQDRFCVCMK
jgi:hypothetical protein